jgi:hypothetical protein
MMSRLSLRLCLVALLFASSSAYTPVNPNGKSRRGGASSPSSSSSSRSSPPNMIAQKMLKTVGTEQERGKSMRLSNSVLAGCDTLPSFQTAHGILSPETVSRMNENTRNNRVSNEAVSTFLKTYQQSGPMSCLHMLSDPEILPHLTKAMRDIAQ